MKDKIAKIIACVSVWTAAGAHTTKTCGSDVLKYFYHLLFYCTTKQLFISSIWGAACLPIPICSDGYEL
jgi:hypothetical protein